MNIFLIIIYTIFVYIESTAILCRYSGKLSDLLALGYTLHNAVLAINRFLGFMIGPVIGYMIESGATKSKIIETSIICFTLGSIATAVSLFFNKKQIEIFSGILINIKINGYKLTSFFYFNPVKNKNYSKLSDFGKIRRLNFRLVLATAITSSLYYGVSFYLAIVAIENISYRGTVLQLTGLVTGLGSLLLNFYTFPLVSYMEMNDNHVIAYQSMYVGKIIGISLVSILIIEVFSKLSA